MLKVTQSRTTRTALCTLLVRTASGMAHAGASPHWEKLWAQDGGLPKGSRFDVAGVARPLAAELSRRSNPRPGATALVPGCGRAYDALALAHHGYASVVAVDLSPAACEAAREELRASRVLADGSGGSAVRGAWRARYVGVVLDTASVEALAAAVPPRHRNITGQQHLTLAFEPAAAELAAALPLLGTRCALRVDAEASDAHGQAVIVSLACPELAESLGAIMAGGSGRRTAHITLSTAGVEASYSNELVQRREALRPLAAAPLFVTGQVAVAVEPPAAAATPEGRAAAKASRRIVGDPEEAARLLRPMQEGEPEEPLQEGEPESAAANAANAAARVEVVCADFFTLDHRARYDLIWDCTFLCALEPEARSRWAEQMRTLLSPGGELLTAVFPIGEREGGPPYAMSVPLVRSLLEPLGFEAVAVLDDLPLEEQHRRPSDELSSVRTRGTALVSWKMTSGR